MFIKNLFFASYTTMRECGMGSVWGMGNVCVNFLFIIGICMNFLFIFLFLCKIYWIVCMCVFLLREKIPEPEPMRQNLGVKPKWWNMAWNVLLHKQKYIFTYHIAKQLKCRIWQTLSLEWRDWAIYNKKSQKGLNTLALLICWRSRHVYFF